MDNNTITLCVIYSIYSHIISRVNFETDNYYSLFKIPNNK